ncbi:MAG TPA: hypothetical protein VEQ42_13735, partial [Pyrinomonadaceae bacterium]|nr:hypothetical protein [Pyrinomonadaceae bacterium]
MFSSLVESGSHKRDWKRKGSFFLGTLGFYAVLLSAAGVGSIYAYNARLDDEADYEILALMRFASPAPEAPQARREERPAAARRSDAPRETTRPEISVNTPYNNRPVASMTTREVSARERVRIAPQTQDAVEPAGVSGPVGPGSPFGNPNSNARPGGGPVVRPDDGVEAPEMRARPTPTPTPAPRRPVSLGPLGGRAVSLPKPEYSQIARAAKAQGPVTVQIVVDEAGRVVSAQA